MVVFREPILCWSTTSSVKGRADNDSVDNAVWGRDGLGHAGDE
jgi:hypothetical protein